MGKNRSEFQYVAMRVTRWKAVIVKFYYAPGKQTTKTLGLKKQINRKQAR